MFSIHKRQPTYSFGGLYTDAPVAVKRKQEHVIQNIATENEQIRKRKTRKPIKRKNMTIPTNVPKKKKQRMLKTNSKQTKIKNKKKVKKLKKKIRERAKDRF